MRGGGFKNWDIDEVACASAAQHKGEEALSIDNVCSGLYYRRERPAIARWVRRRLLRMSSCDGGVTTV